MAIRPVVLVGLGVALSSGAAWAVERTPPKSVLHQGDVLRESVLQALASDRAVSEGVFEVQARNGVVRISGTVDSLPAKERALHIAEGIRGVRDVEDGLRVE